jgi:hypothetical protein
MFISITILHHLSSVFSASDEVTPDIVQRLNDILTVLHTWAYHGLLAAELLDLRDKSNGRIHISPTCLFRRTASKNSLTVARISGIEPNFASHKPQKPTLHVPTRFTSIAR